MDTLRGGEDRQEDADEDTNFTIPENPRVVNPQWQLPPRAEEQPGTQLERFRQLAVDNFYNSVARKDKRLPSARYYTDFFVDAEGKPRLIKYPDIPLTKPDGLAYALSTLASKLGGIGSLRNELKLLDYAPNKRSPKVVASVEQIDTAAQEVEAAPTTDLEHTIPKVIASIEHVAEEPEWIQEALNTLDDPSHPDISEAEIEVSLKRRGWPPLRDLEAAARDMATTRGWLLSIHLKMHELYRTPEAEI